MIWLMLALLTTATIFYIATPLYRDAEPPVISEDIAAYRAEIEAAKDGYDSNLQRQLIARADKLAPKNGMAKTGAAKVWLAAIFITALAATPWLYHTLGRPDLTRQNSSPTPTAQTEMTPQERIQNMSPEERSAMISAMVEGLSARLKADPKNVEGWVRLLRSRTVMGQTGIGALEIKLMRSTYAEQPEIIADILARSGWE